MVSKITMSEHKTNALRKKYTGDSSGKLYGLKGKDKSHERQINSPHAKLKRAYRSDIEEGHSNRIVERELARLNRGKSPIWNKISSHG
jgi:hypothetical protein